MTAIDKKYIRVDNDLIEWLDKKYPDTLEGITTPEDLTRRKIQREVLQDLKNFNKRNK